MIKLQSTNILGDQIKTETNSLSHFVELSHQVFDSSWVTIISRFENTGNCCDYLNKQRKIKLFITMNKTTCERSTIVRIKIKQIRFCSSVTFLHACFVIVQCWRGLTRKDVWSVKMTVQLLNTNNARSFVILRSGFPIKSVFLFV